MVIFNHFLLLVLVVTTSFLTTRKAVQAFVVVQEAAIACRTTGIRNIRRSQQHDISIGYPFALFYNDKNSNSHQHHDSSSSTNKPSWWISAEWMQPEESTPGGARGVDTVKNQQQQKKTKQEGQQQRPLPFAQGKELQDLRSDILQMKQNLQLSLATDDLMRVVALTKSLEEAKKRDPEVVYTKALKMIAGAGKYHTKKKYQVITRYNKEAKVARSYIARLNMGGLWVANFGQGSELVNVTYTGDTMIATRLNSPEHFLFQADLSPMDTRSSSAQYTAPIPIDKSAVSKWGIDKLERYPGKAIHPRTNSRSSNNKSSSSSSKEEINLLDGNLIMFDGYFSFLWIPTRQHVFFSRPKPELVLKLMRDTISEQDEIENMRYHLTKCFKKGIEEAFVRPSMGVHGSIVEPFRRISRESDLLAAQEEIQIVYETGLDKSSFTNSGNKFSGIGIPSTSTKAAHQSFWDFHKWLHYIDKVMKPNEMENNNN